MKINIQYFAKFKEKTGKSNETFNTDSVNLSALYNELDKKYNFAMHKNLIRAAVNEEFCDWEKELNDNDTVVFIQPVAGG